VDNFDISENTRGTSGFGSSGTKWIDSKEEH
jgi:dUTPase